MHADVEENVRMHFPFFCFKTSTKHRFNITTFFRISKLFRIDF